MESFWIGRRTLTTVDLYEGRIILTKFAVLNILHDRADITTGGWKINSHALATWYERGRALKPPDVPNREGHRPARQFVWIELVGTEEPPGVRCLA
jgi:hypothetical protein